MSLQSTCDEAWQCLLAITTQKCRSQYRDCAHNMPPNKLPTLYYIFKFSTKHLSTRFPVKLHSSTSVSCGKVPHQPKLDLPFVYFVVFDVVVWFFLHFFWCLDFASFITVFLLVDIKFVCIVNDIDIVIGAVFTCCVIATTVVIVIVVVFALDIVIIVVCVSVICYCCCHCYLCCYCHCCYCHCCQRHTADTPPLEGLFILRRAIYDPLERLQIWKM